MKSPETPGRFKLADTTSVVTSAGHLWHTKVRGSAAKCQIRTTEQVFKDGRIFRIPVAPPRHGPAANLTVPPYLLGLWLGDGTRGKCEISVSEADLANVQHNLLDVGVESWPRRYAPFTSVNLTFTRARGFGMVNRPEVAKALQKLPCYRDKHVPAEYLTGSIEQRTELLRGLMDSDGSITALGTCTFVSTSQRLADAVTVLLRSLGQVTSGSKWVADDRYTNGGKLRVDFTPRAGLMPFKLQRKVVRVRQHAKGSAWITISAIYPAAKVPIRCIRIDSDDHLFAAGVSGHLTHDTKEWDADQWRVDGSRGYGRCR